MAKYGNGKQKLTATVTDIKFEILENRTKGRVIVSYERYDDRGHKNLEVRCPLLSCWMDASSGNAIKAHFALYNNPTHNALLRDMNQLGILHAPNGFGLVTDGVIVRYGKRPGDTYTMNDPENYDTLHVYDSKAKALQEIMSRVQRDQTIGGLKLISFNRLPDSILIESGFDPIMDVMKSSGVVMWKGSPDRALTGTGGTSYQAAKAGRKQFLDLISRTINVEEKPAV